MTLRDEFEKFDRENPEIWKMFCRFAGEAMAAGHTVLSANFIFERIRWETTVVTSSPEGFKVNNNHRAYYARKFNAECPNANGQFDTRAVRGEIEQQLEIHV